MNYGTKQILDIINKFKEDLSVALKDIKGLQIKVTKLIELEAADTNLMKASNNLLKAISKEVDLLKEGSDVANKRLDLMDRRFFIEDKKIELYCTRICPHGKEEAPGKHEVCSACPLFDVTILGGSL